MPFRPERTVQIGQAFDRRDSLQHVRVGGGLGGQAGACAASEPSAQTRAPPGDALRHCLRAHGRTGGVNCCRKTGRNIYRPGRALPACTAKNDHHCARISSRAAKYGGASFAPPVLFDNNIGIDLCPRGFERRGAASEGNFRQERRAKTQLLAGTGATVFSTCYKPSETATNRQKLRQSVRNRGYLLQTVRICDYWRLPATCGAPFQVSRPPARRSRSRPQPAPPQGNSLATAGANRMIWAPNTPVQLRLRQTSREVR